MSQDLLYEDNNSERSRVRGPEEEQRADLWMDRVTEDVKSVDVREEEAANRVRWRRVNGRGNP